jgi:flagellar secretion chaperone FliS
MFNNGYSLNTQHNQLNPYLVKEIMEATPQQLIIKVYDFAVVNCQRQNIEKTNRAIQELINSLRFEDPGAREIAIGLLKLYQYCQEEMRNRNYDIVLKILTELRETWQSLCK